MAAVSGAETQAVLDELSNEIDRLNKENAALRQRVQLLTHRLFGRRSEKGVPVIEQGVLPLEPAAAGPVQAAEHMMRELGVAFDAVFANADAQRKDGHTVMFVAIDGRPAGLISLAIRLKRLPRKRLRCRRMTTSRSSF